MQPVEEVLSSNSHSLHRALSAVFWIAIGAFSASFHYSVDYITGAFSVPAFAWEVLASVGQVYLILTWFRLPDGKDGRARLFGQLGPRPPFWGMALALAGLVGLSVDAWSAEAALFDPIPSHLDAPFGSHEQAQKMAYIGQVAVMVWQLLGLWSGIRMGAAVRTEKKAR
jgi:hypothetical protein